MHSHCVSGMHKYAVEVSNLPIVTEIEHYPIYLKAKLYKANTCTSFTRKGTKRNQNISIRFVFIVQSPSGNELDAASTHDQVHHISSEVIPDEEAFGSFTRRKIMQLRNWEF
jgi:hypothetical protein